MAWLAALVAVGVVVAARQASAFGTAARLRTLREERLALEARRADLERRIRRASSRQVLAPLVERTLGLHQPSDSEFVLFPAPHRPAGRR
jgi:hypothetical protein